MDAMLVLCRLSSMLIPLVQEEEECSLYSVSAQACTHTTTHAQYERNMHHASVKRCGMHMHLCYIRIRTATYVRAPMYTWLYNYNPFYKNCVWVCLPTFTDLMWLVTAPTKWPPARQLTTRWMRGLLLQDVLGGTSVLALLGILWRSASKGGLAVWRRLSKHSMERYVCICIVNWS